MPRLGHVGECFNEPVKIVGGARTVARIQRSSDGDQPGVEFAAPKTVLRVRPHSILTAGLVVELPGGDKGLLADHSAQADYRTLHFFQTDRQVKWERPNKTVNPVSLQKQDAPPTNMGNIWVMWERTRREFMDLAIRIAQENYLVATGAPVEKGDYVDGKLVRRVAHALGIRILELQG